MGSGLSSTAEPLPKSARVTSDVASSAAAVETAASSSSFSSSSFSSSASSFLSPGSPASRIRSMTSVDQEVSEKLRRRLLEMRFLPSSDVDDGPSSPSRGSSNKILLSSTFTLASECRDFPSCLPLDDRITSLMAEVLPPSTCLDFVPLRTDGDGNCLLHSTCLSMFGSHDRNSVLRQLVTSLLSSGDLASLIEDAWSQDELLNDQNLQADFGVEVTRSSSVLRREYSEVASQSVCSNSYLGSLHVLALCHVVRRPIIVYGRPSVLDSSGSPLSPCDVIGVYLPIALPPSACCRVPVALAFSCGSGGVSGHFTSIAGFEGGEEGLRLPLFDVNNRPLAIRYSHGSWMAGCSREQLLQSYTNLCVVEGGGEYADYGGAVYQLPESQAIQRKFMEIALNTSFQEASV